MYCAKCGVELADTEKKCPLCGTRAFHPDILREEGEKLYPENKYPPAKKDTRLWQVLLTVAFVLPVLIVLLCDLQFNARITWSGYVMGGLLLGYVVFVLPMWFKRPNPIVFCPCDFAAAGVYVLYINQATDGDWFLSFALPVVFGFGAVCTAVVTLLVCLRRGRLFVFGGALMAVGALTVLMEFLLSITFSGLRFIGWSLYPLITLLCIGGVLIFLGACRPARESMEKKLFI